MTRIAHIDAAAIMVQWNKEAFSHQTLESSHVRFLYAHETNGLFFVASTLLCGKKVKADFLCKSIASQIDWSGQYELV